MLRKIAFLGTGLMGGPMARQLLTAHHSVSVWNRTLEKAEALVGFGGLLASTPEDAVADADIIITMLSNGEAVSKIINQTKNHLSSDATWIDMSSTKPSEAKANFAQLANLSVACLDAPVSGGVAGAEAGTLAIMVGGDSTAFEIAKPVLQNMGIPVLVGPTGSGQLAKLANQTIVAVTIGAVAEATLFLKENGADPSAVRQALAGGFADSKILQMHGARMTDGNFDPGGLSRLQLKDLVNALEQADLANLRLPLTQNVHDRFTRLCDELEGGELDHSALFIELCNLNGIEG